jgi:hypothetical protein
VRIDKILISVVTIVDLCGGTTSRMGHFLNAPYGTVHEARLGILAIVGLLYLILRSQLEIGRIQDAYYSPSTYLLITKHISPN